MSKNFDFIDLSNIKIKNLTYNEKNINVKIVFKKDKKRKNKIKIKKKPLINIPSYIKYYFNNPLLKKLKKT